MDGNSAFSACEHLLDARNRKELDIENTENWLEHWENKQREDYLDMGEECEDVYDLLDDITDNPVDFILPIIDWEGPLLSESADLLECLAARYDYGIDEERVNMFEERLNALNDEYEDLEDSWLDCIKHNLEGGLE